MTAPLHAALRDRLYDLTRDHFALDADHPIAPATTIAGNLHAGGLEADSLDLVEFAMRLEDEFEVEIADDVAADASTIGAIEDWLAENLPHCRTCGCTENRACLTGGQPCGWADPETCTACKGE